MMISIRINDDFDANVVILVIWSFVIFDLENTHFTHYKYKNIFLYL